MNVLLQRHFAAHIYPVPEGLRELMSDISREVIRSNPDDMYTFIADYLDALMVTRENARVAARLVEDIVLNAGTTTYILKHLDLSKEEAEEAATKIQQSFRAMVERKTPCTEPLPEDLEDDVVKRIMEEAGLEEEDIIMATKVIQKSYKDYMERKEKGGDRELLEGMIDWKVASRSAICLYRKTGASYEETSRAATLIKAAYKGYHTRRNQKLAKKKGGDDDDSFDYDDDFFEDFDILDTAFIDEDSIVVEAEAIKISPKKPKPKSPKKKVKQAKGRGVGFNAHKDVIAHEIDEEMSGETSSSPSSEESPLPNDSPDPSTENKRVSTGTAPSENETLQTIPSYDIPRVPQNSTYDEDEVEH